MGTSNSINFHSPPEISHVDYPGLENCVGFRLFHKTYDTDSKDYGYSDVVIFTYPTANWLKFLLDVRDTCQAIILQHFPAFKNEVSALEDSTTLAEALPND